MSFGTRFINVKNEYEDYLEEIEKANGEGFTLNKKQIIAALRVTKINIEYILKKLEE